MRFLYLFFLFFTASNAHAQAPWLPFEKQAALRAILPEGVPFGEDAKFYSLPQVYQELIFLNGSPSWRVLPVTNKIHPWAVSGGMHWANPADWRNSVALELPKGQKVSWWVEQTDAGAPGPVPKVRWQFPVGTVAYDVLIRRRAYSERVFEVRIHRKLRDGWSAGETWRPQVDYRKSKSWQHDSWHTIDTISTGRTVFPTRYFWHNVERILDGTPFVRTSQVAIDRGWMVPANYYGAGARCNECHQHVGKRTGYGEALRGDDGRFSWHPFLSDGRMDGRWPMARRQ